MSVVRWRDVDDEHLRQRSLVHVGVAEIADDADDFEPRVLAGDGVERETRSDRIAAGPEPPRGFLVDQRHGRGVGHLRIRDRAALSQRDPHRRQQVAGDRRGATSGRVSGGSATVLSIVSLLVCSSSAIGSRSMTPTEATPGQRAKTRQESVTNRSIASG